MNESDLATTELQELVGLECWSAGFPNEEDVQLNIGEAESIQGSPRGTTIGTHILSELQAEAPVNPAAARPRGSR